MTRIENTDIEFVETVWRGELDNEDVDFDETVKHDKV